MIGDTNELNRMFNALSNVARLQDEISVMFRELTAEDPEEMVRLQDELILYYQVALEASQRRRAYAQRVANDQTK